MYPVVNWSYVRSIWSNATIKISEIRNINRFIFEFILVFVYKITLEVITDKAVMILTHNDNIISFDHSSIGICDKYAGHMITTDKKCAMLELLLISKS